MTPDYWETAKADLAAADEVMAGIIAAYPDGALQSRGDAFLTLARSIVGQQISVKAADSVWAKFEAQLGRIETASLLAQSDDALRSCGLSRQKIAYLRNIAEHFDAHGVKAGFFDEMSDDESLKFLIEIKGVGRWTAEMFLMFHLLRPNVWPIDDIGLQNAMIRHYGIQKNNKKELLNKITAHAERWQPWRSVATWYLWRSLDPVPVAY